MLANIIPRATQQKKNKYKGILNFFLTGQIPIDIISVFVAPKDNKINMKKNKKNDFINLKLFS